jgi:hypothetical protein
MHRYLIQSDLDSDSNDSALIKPKKVIFLALKK